MEGCLAGPEIQHHIHHVYDFFATQIEEHAEDAERYGLYLDGRFTSYMQIWQTVNIVTPQLRQLLPELRHPQPVPLVAIEIDPSPELLIAILSVIGLGYAYIPLDPILPEERIRFILNGVEPAAVLINTLDQHHWYDNPSNLNGVLAIDITSLMANKTHEASEQENRNESEPKIYSEVLAVQYTSGSTGSPKGVLIKHESLLNRVIWQWNAFPWRAGEVSCFKISVLFIDSMVELFGAVLALVPMVIAPRYVLTNIDRFVDVLERYQVTRLIFVPSLLRNILAYVALEHPRPRLQALDLWISNSETLPPKVLESFQEFFPDKKFAIFYGSTETMADVTYERFDNRLDLIHKCHEGRLSLGTPMYNSNVYITDPDLNILPNGEIGEICVSGVQVAEGYISADGGVSRTNDFVTNSFSDEPHHKVLYKTGDFGKILNGRIYFYGRRDNQFKVHGQRIDPCEVEHVISGITGIKRVEVMCHNVNEYMPIVAAYYTTTPNSDVTSRDITDICRRNLPPYMIPKPIKVHHIPLQPQSGKTDRQALKKFFDRMRLNESKLSHDLDSLDESSQQILRVVAKVCNLPETSVSLSVSFEQLGGNSVSSVECIVRLRKQGYHITFEDFLGARSIREMMSKCEPIACYSPGLSMDSKYKITRLSDACREREFTDMFTRAFIEKEPLTTCLGLQYEDFYPSAASMYSLALNTPSIIITRKCDGMVVGADILTDFDSDEDIYWDPKSEPIKQLLMETEHRAREMNSAKGLMRHSILCVETSLPQAERLKLVLFMEEEVLNHARRLGYGGVIGCNTNKVTQNICEHFLGYHVLFTTDVRQYCLNGRRPFNNAPEDCTLKMMVKLV